MVEHCISALLQKREQKAYRVYVTDALKVIAENTSRFNGGATMNGRWFDLVDVSKPKAKEQSQEEIINRLRHKLISLG